LLETAVRGCSVARRRGIVEESTLEERRRGGRERVAGAGLMRVIEVWDNREATWRRGVVANIREQAGRFRHWLVWGYGTRGSGPADGAVEVGGCGAAGGEGEEWRRCVPAATEAAG
jgi:hypothetical protein